VVGFGSVPLLVVQTQRVASEIRRASTA